MTRMGTDQGYLNVFGEVDLHSNRIGPKVAGVPSIWPHPDYPRQRKIHRFTHFACKITWLLRDIRLGKTDHTVLCLS